MLIWSVIFVDAQPYAVLETLSPYELWARSQYTVLFYIGKEEHGEIADLLRQRLPQSLSETDTPTPPR